MFTVIFIVIVTMFAFAPFIAEGIIEYKRN